jgi:hypothetical protein
MTRYRDRGDPLLNREPLPQSRNSISVVADRNPFLIERASFNSKVTP